MSKVRSVVAVILAAVLVFSGFSGVRSVEAAEAKLNKSKAETDTGEKMSLKIKTSLEAVYYYTDVEKYDENTGRYYYPGNVYSYEEKGKGKFSYTFYEGGTYRVSIGAYDADYNWDSASCIVKVRNVGPSKRNIAVLKDSEILITTDNAVFERAEIVKDENDWYWYSSDGEVSIAGNRIRGIQEGRVTVRVYYRPDLPDSPGGGKLTDADIKVYITDPVYTPIEGYKLAGYYEYLNLDGVSDYSDVTVTTDNEEVCIWNGYCLEITGAGKCKLTIIADGRKFTDTIEAYAPSFSDPVLLLKKKKEHTVKVSGLPDGIKVKYTSADKKIATVSKDGKVKAKAAGSTYITVKCGDLVSYTCYVTVSSGGKAFEAAKKAAGFIGGRYSQDRRMEDGYFDCSSLVWRSYKAAGCLLAGESKYAPTAANLAKKLEEEGRTISYKYVDPSELKPGDLIFYSSGSNGRYKNIDHVAMYYAAGNAGSYYMYGFDYYYEPEYNGGIIIHATSPAVHMAGYSGYIPDRIVMICRPVE